MANFWHQYGIYISPLVVAAIDAAIGKWHPSPAVNNLLQWVESFFKSPPSPPQP